jgi:hypothetical protein
MVNRSIGDLFIAERANVFAGIVGYCYLPGDEIIIVEKSTYARTFYNLRTKMYFEEAIPTQESLGIKYTIIRKVLTEKTLPYFKITNTNE